MNDNFARIDRLFQRVLGGACVLLFVVMILAVGGQVVMRYAFNSPLSWSEELARHTMVWLAMLATALCARLGQHIALSDLIPLPAKVKLVVNAAGLVVVFIVLCVLTYHALSLTGRASRQTTPGLGLSMSYAYASIPTGSILMIVGLALGWIRAALDLRSGHGDGAAPREDKACP